MKKKNKLKQNVSSCFMCGKDFNSLQEKHGHRINPKKGNCENNLVILCEKCKRRLQNKRDIKIYQIKIKREVKDKYFSKLDKDKRYVILQKLREFKRRSLEGEKSQDRI